MSDEYQTVAEVAESKLVVKKSRFIGLATSVGSTEASKVFLDLAGKQYPNASHYCYAYRIGFGAQTREYATDAGEPTNSAGPPILAAVNGSGLSNIICVVVRYYGGINLGVGGLIRSYGQTARDCLKAAKIETHVFYQSLHVRTPYEKIGPVLNLCRRLGGIVASVEYDQCANAYLKIRQREVENFKADLHRIRGADLVSLENV